MIKCMLAIIPCLTAFFVGAEQANEQSATALKNQAANLRLVEGAMRDCSQFALEPTIDQSRCEQVQWDISEALERAVKNQRTNEQIPHKNQPSLNEPLRKAK
jgi:hypothetical protein